MSTRSPVFVWLFGYVGDTFYPQTQLDISTSTVIYLAQGLSSNVGASNLRIVGPVDQEQGHNIQNTTIPTIKSYVDCLRHFASVVYGRIDLEQYNITSSPSLFEVAAMYVNQLDVNGIWFDHAPELYNSSGQFAFNWYMQNITKNFPQLNYLVDQSAAQFHSYITPLSNDTWGTMSYITPTTYASSDNNLSLSKIQDLNKIYPGRVVVHYDAFAGDDTAPMSYFSVQSSAQEVSAVNTLVHEGAFPSSSNQSFSFLFPIIGAWTQNDSMYSGTLYNSLSVGNYYRDTYNNFTQAMITNYVLSPFSPTYSMQYTGAIAIIPLIGLVTLGIKSSRNELLDKFQKIDKANARFVS